MLIDPINKKKIAVIGGSGPEAGIDLCKKLLLQNKNSIGENYSGDLDALNFILISNPILGLSMELPKKELFIWKFLKLEIEKIFQNVDYYIIACNTLHFYESRIKEVKLDSKMISFVNVVKEFIENEKISKVAILGSKQVMDIDGLSPYKGLKKITDVEVYSNELELHELIYMIKKVGPNNILVIKRFEKIIRNLEAQYVLLACTELSLIKINSYDKTIVDVTTLVVKKAVYSLISDFLVK